MAAYRFYMLNCIDAVAESMEDQFEDDRRALARAESVCRNYFAVEVWSGERLVGRIGEEFQIGWPKLLL